MDLTELEGKCWFRPDASRQSAENFLVSQPPVSYLLIAALYISMFCINRFDVVEMFASGSLIAPLTLIVPGRVCFEEECTIWFTGIDAQESGRSRWSRIGVPEARRRSVCGSLNRGGCYCGANNASAPHM
jgi:hypothetical protein